MSIQKLAPIVAAISLLLAGAATATAHVEVVPAPGGATGEIILSVPNESSRADTVSVAVQLPDNVVRVSVPEIGGWTHVEQTVPRDPPIRIGGVDLATRVSTVTWTGGRIHGDKETGFRLGLAVADGTARTGLAFPAVQRYSDGKVVRWIGGPASDTPAGVLEAALPAVATAAVTTTTSTAPATTPATTTAAATPSKDSGNPVGVIFALVGAAIAIGGVVAVIRARRTKPRPDPPVSRR